MHPVLILSGTIVIEHALQNNSMDLVRSYLHRLNYFQKYLVCGSISQEDRVPQNASALIQTSLSYYYMGMSLVVVVRALH
jgi:hypothetical protein